MNNGFKKAVAVIAAACLAVSTGVFTASALSKADVKNGQVSDHLYLQNGADELVSFAHTENFFGDFGYNEAANPVVPGYSNETTATIRNNSDTEVNLWLWAEDSPDAVYQAFKTANPTIVGEKSIADLKSESNQLMNMITLTVTYDYEDTDDDGNDIIRSKTIYEGNMTGNKVKTTTMRETGTDNDNAIFLGTYSPNEVGVLKIKYTVPKELTNVYANKTAIVDWVFTAKQVDAKILAPDNPPTPPSPGTGEASIPFVIAATACGLSAIAIVAITFGRRKKEEA